MLSWLSRDISVAITVVIAILSGVAGYHMGQGAEARLAPKLSKQLCHCKYYKPLVKQGELPSGE